MLVCGSRNVVDLGALIDGLSIRFGVLPEDTELISGGAPGVDSWADWIYLRYFPHRPRRVFKADWKKHKKAAGPIRNRQMLDEKPDLVIAYWDGESPGTKDTVTEARKRGIPVEVVAL